MALVKDVEVVREQEGVEGVELEQRVLCCLAAALVAVEQRWQWQLQQATQQSGTLLKRLLM